MQRKVVVKVYCMNGHKSRSKALKIVVGVSGVESASLKGQEMDQIEVTGDNIDAVAITTLLRKKVGFAELVAVAPVEDQEPTIQPLALPSRQVVFRLDILRLFMCRRLCSMILLAVPSCDFGAQNQQMNVEIGWESLELA